MQHGHIKAHIAGNGGTELCVQVKGPAGRQGGSSRPRAPSCVHTLLVAIASHSTTKLRTYHRRACFDHSLTWHGVIHPKGQPHRQEKWWGRQGCSLRQTASSQLECLLHVGREPAAAPSRRCARRRDAGGGLRGQGPIQQCTMCKRQPGREPRPGATVGRGFLRSPRRASRCRSCGCFACFRRLLDLLMSFHSHAAPQFVACTQGVHVEGTRMSMGLIYCP